MAEPKRGSVEAFKAAEERRKARIKKVSKPNVSEARQARKDAFNAKVAANNKRVTNQDSVKKFKAAEERRKSRVAKVNKMNPDSPKAKRIAAAAATTGAKAAATKAMTSDRAYANKPQSKTATASSPKVKVKASPPKAQASVKSAGSFADAFKKARAQGVGTKFAYNDKQYSAVTRDDVSRAGKSSLKDFLNASKRKATTKIAKAPGQREEALIARRAVGGEMRSGSKRKMTAEERKRILNQLRERSKNRAKPMPYRPKAGEENRARPMPLPIPPKVRAPRGGIGSMPRERMPEERRRRMPTPERISILDQMNKRPEMDRYKSGGSVMARGCKMGRKKATKLY
jgi:hypothetical protein